MYSALKNIPEHCYNFKFYLFKTGFEVLMAVGIKTIVFRNATLCSWVHILFGGYFAFFTLKIETVGPSETLVSTYETTRRHILEDSNVSGS
jgi:hypothetical protein